MKHLLSMAETENIGLEFIRVRSTNHDNTSNDTVVNAIFSLDDDYDDLSFFKGCFFYLGDEYGFGVIKAVVFDPGAKMVLMTFRSPTNEESIEINNWQASQTPKEELLHMERDAIIQSLEGLGSLMMRAAELLREK